MIPKAIGIKCLEMGSPESQLYKLYALQTLGTFPLFGLILNFENIIIILNLYNQKLHTFVKYLTTVNLLWNYHILSILE